MTTLVENPLAIVVVGGLAILLAAIVFFARRDGPALGALVGVVLVTALMLLVERLVVTDREQVEAAVAGLLAAIEANDIERTLAAIDPAAARIRSDVQALSPLIKVQKARSMGPMDVAVDGAEAPPTAEATFQAFLQGVHVPSATPLGYVNQRVELHWVKRDGRWLLDGYTAYYEGRPIDAVGSATSNRAIPSP